MIQRCWNRNVTSLWYTFHYHILDTMRTSRLLKDIGQLTRPHVLCSHWKFEDTYTVYNVNGLLLDIEERMESFGLRTRGLTTNLPTVYTKEQHNTRGVFSLNVRNEPNQTYSTNNSRAYKRNSVLLLWACGESNERCRTLSDSLVWPLGVVFTPPKYVHL